MNYICADRGTERCPCPLMETGQCYTCTMTRDGTCRCQEAAGWQGCCPYGEYMQQGGRILDAPSHRLSAFRILSKTCFSGDLFFVRLAVSRGIAEQCRQPGAYVMAEAMGWRTPVSVLRAGGEIAETPSGQFREVDFLLKAVGPKTRWLTEDGRKEWRVAGPYFNGLLNFQTGSSFRDGKKPALVIGRGTALAPLVNLLEWMDCILYIDDENLPEVLMEEYFRGQPFERIRLNDEEDLEMAKAKIGEHLQKEGGSVFLLVSPYFMERLLEGLREEERNRIAVPNHANLCCAMGICGACSSTDKEGTSVKLCKCSEKMIK